MIRYNGFSRLIALVMIHGSALMSGDHVVVIEDVVFSRASTFESQGQVGD